MRGPQSRPAAAHQQTFKVMGSQYKKQASGRNSDASEDIKELTHREQIEKLEEQLALKDQELSRLVPVLTGSYCSSGATPLLLHSYSEKVLMDLDNFVLFSVPPETPIEVVNALRARVSDIFFSKFEQINFGVKKESLFTTRGLLTLLPEQALTEFKAFSACADNLEDEAVKPYMPKYECFLAIKQAKIEKTCDKVKFNEVNYAHFYSLAINVWMLHKLAFSFESANVRLMRVVPGEPFIDKFMEAVGQQDQDQLKGKPPATTTTVKYVILPGLWINSSIIKCRVCLGSATGQKPSTAPATQLREGVNGTGPRNVDVTSKQVHQPTSSQVPAIEAHARAHQQTQAMEYTVTDEPHISLLPHEELQGNDKTPAVEVSEQAAQEMTNMDSTNSSPEEPLQPPPTTVTENYHGNSPTLYSASTDSSYHGGAEWGGGGRCE